MKLLFTISFYRPNISGLTLSPARLAEELVRRGYKIRILTTLYDNNLKIEDKINGVDIVRVPYLFKISKGFIMPRYFWIAFKEVKMCDAVVVNLPQFEGFIPAFFAKVLGKKLVCIYHCEVTLPKTLGSIVVENLLHFANYISLFLADKIVTYTQDYAINSKLLPNFKKKLLFILPPIKKPGTSGKLNSKLQNILAKFRGNRYIIGIAARIAAEKGIDYLLTAMPYLKERLDKDIIIVFAGPKEPVGEKEYLHILSLLIDKYKEYIIFLGEVTPQELEIFYNSLDVLVLPSVNSTEAFGMVQVEAMYFGVPVVASNLPGVRVPVQKTGMGEIANPGDAKDLADKIIKVLTNKNKYLKSHEIIKKIFDFDDTINKYEKLFKSLNNVPVSE